MGVGNLQQALTAYGEGTVPYAQLYFDSSPLRHAAAWRKLASLGDDSSTYLWRVLAAREIMRLYRSDPRPLAARGGAAVPQGLGRGGPAPGRAHDGVRRPASPSAARGRPASCARIDANVLAPYGLRIDSAHGRARAAHQASRRACTARCARRRSRCSRRSARRRRRSRAPQPLVVTSTVRDKDYQQRPGRDRPGGHPAYSLHTTGCAFDIARAYRSRAQALAFQFVLDRLTARGIIAWVREPGAIHVTVASG